MEKDEELRLLKELEELRHSNRIIEIEIEAKKHRETEAVKFDHQMQLQRIRSAEIRRTIDRKGDRDFMEGYARK